MLINSYLIYMQMYLQLEEVNGVIKCHSKLRGDTTEFDNAKTVVMHKNY